jgi:hypothetical protein
MGNPVLQIFNLLAVENFFWPTELQKYDKLDNGHRLSSLHVVCVCVQYFSFFTRPQFFINVGIYELSSISAEVGEGIEKII